MDSDANLRVCQHLEKGVGILLSKTTNRIDLPRGIRELAMRHEFHSYVSPMYEHLDRNKAQIGWQVEVCGTNSPWQAFQMLGSAGEAATCEALRTFLAWVLHDLSICTIEVICEPQKTYFWDKHRNRPDKIITAQLRPSIGDPTVRTLLPISSLLEQRLTQAGATHA